MTKPTFKWDDPFLLNDQPTDEERMIRDTALFCKPFRNKAFLEKG